MSVRTRSANRAPRASGIAPLAVASVLAVLTPIRACADDVPPVTLVQTIALPGVAGRIDHLAVDVAGQRLFVAARGNDTVEVVDLRAGARARTLRGFHAPQGVAFVPAVDALFVANGEGGALDVLDATSLLVRGRITFAEEADNLRYDPAEQRLYVGHGAGALAVVDAKTGTRLADVAVGGHPEAFALETSGPRIFVNVPNARAVAVVDRRRRAAIGRWPLRAARGNFPMALDDADHRLFVGVRTPARLLVLDVETGREIGDVESPRDADDLFYDAARKRVYMSCGEGVLAVFEQRGRDRCALRAALPTAPGARTSLFVPELRRLYVAVPRRGVQGAEIRVFAVGSDASSRSGGVTPAPR